MKDGTKTEEQHKPGSLCLDNDHKCVLVKVGESTDAPYLEMMAQAGMLKPFGWLLDLDNIELIFGTTEKKQITRTTWAVSVFTRNLDTVEWL